MGMTYKYQQLSTSYVYKWRLQGEVTRLQPASKIQIACKLKTALVEY